MKIYFERLHPFVITDSIQPGELIAVEDDVMPRGFLVVYGRVSLVKTSISGKELIVELLPPGDSFGLLAAIEQGGVSLYGTTSG